MFTFKDIGGFMPKKKLVEVESHTEEKSLKTEVEEMK